MGHFCIHRLLAAIEKLADSYPISSSDSTQLILKYTFAIVIVDLQPAPPFSSQNLSFLLGNNFNFRRVEAADVMLDVSSGATVSITLPGVLFTSQYLSNNTRIVYRCFLNSRPFLRRREYVTRQGLQYNRVGGVTVTAHTVNGSILPELREPVRLKFLKNPVSKHMKYQELFEILNCDCLFHVFLPYIRHFTTALTQNVHAGTSHWMKNTEDGPLRIVPWWRRPEKRRFVNATTLETLLSPW